MKNLFLTVLITIILTTGCASMGKTDKNAVPANSETLESDVEVSSDEDINKKTFTDELAGENGNTEEPEEIFDESTEYLDINNTAKKTDNIPEIDYQEVKPYEVGRIMVIMYHGIEDLEKASDKYQRTLGDFKNDLQTLYDDGFCLISLRDYVNNDIKIPAGKSPVILTFDDGISSSFSLVNDDGKLVPRLNCAVDVINKFYSEHPDFGRGAVFFINRNPFPGDGSLKDAFKYLVDNGYEIGNHTLNHKELNTLTAEEILAEVGAVEKLIQENLPGYETLALSYPYGIRPAEEQLRELCLNGSYEGITYSYKAAFREGQSVSSSAPNREGYDPYNLPRVRGSDSEETDLGWTLRSFRENPDLKYVSDGNPNRISVPDVYKENINNESIGDKELFIYERLIDN